MRTARLQDYKRRLHTRRGDWPVILKSFSFDKISTLGSGQIGFPSPLTVIAGPNGVGKTTLLRALWASAAAGNAELEPSVRLKLSAGTATLTFSSPAGEGFSKATFATGKVQGDSDGALQKIGIEVIHLDASSAVKGQQSDYCKFENIEDLINGVGAKTVDEKVLAEISYVSRRDYREVKIYEVERDGIVAPFFEVAYQDDRYDSRTMGAGELAILYLWWAIDRAPKSAVVLIEEPETYLSSGSQEALTNFVLAATVEKYLNVVITSHSPRVFGSVAEDQVIFMFRDGGSAKIVEGAPPPALLDTLGITMHVDIIALVEDEAAKTFFRLILERHKPGLSRQIEIGVRNGEGNIIAALTKLGGQFDGVKIVGIFDGDARGKVPEDVLSQSAFLPGDRAIETVFREMIQNDPGSLAKATGSGDIGPILFGLQGKEHHDWYEGLCAQLGLSKAQLFPMLFGIWEQREDASGLIEKMFGELKNILQSGSQS